MRFKYGMLMPLLALFGVLRGVTGDVAIDGQRVQIGGPTGAFIVIDESTNGTVGAGMIV